MQHLPRTNAIDGASQAEVLGSSSAEQSVQKQHQKVFEGKSPDHHRRNVAEVVNLLYQTRADQTWCD